MNKQNSFANKLRYTKKQTEEAKFHDQWGNSVEADKIDVKKYFSAGTSPDYHLAMKLLGDLKNKKILDLGCGLGEAPVYFALQEARTIALDISPGMLACAKKLAEKYHLSRKIKFIEAPAEKIPLKDESVDLVFGGNILHHVDINKTAKEIKRVLKKGGRAVFIEPLGYNPIIQIYRFLATDVRTKMERPFTFGDVHLLGRGFRSVKHVEKQLLTTLIFVWFFLGEGLNPRKVRYWKRIIDESKRYEKAFKTLEKLDSIILKIPLLNRMCWNTVIELVK